MSFLSQPLQNVLIRPKRMIGDIAVQVVVNEQTTDTLTITKQPVQQGASVTDHAYMEPTSFSHTIYFAASGFENLLSGGNGLAQVYQKLLALQSSATPFDIVTPKRIYHNMLLGALTQTTDKLTENCLAIHASYQQVIFVPILATTVQRANLKNPGANSPTQNGGAKSALFTLFGPG
jgi:hypothetical protein